MIRKILILFLLLSVASAGLYRLPNTYVDGGLNVKNATALNDTTITNLTATGSLTGTASRIAVGSFIDTAYGLKNSTANKAQVNISTTRGLQFGTGASLGELQIDPTDLLDTNLGYGIKETSDKLRVNASTGLKFGSGASLGALLVEPSDFIDTSYGLLDNSDTIRVNLTANRGLEFGSGALMGSLGIKLDGYSLALGAGGLKLNESDAQEVDTIAVNDVDGLTVATVIVPVYETLVVPINNQSVDEYVFIADDLWYLVKAEEVHSVAGTAVAPNAANLTIRICDDAEAVGSGLNATIDVIPLNDAANTINTASLNNTNIVIQNGDMIAFDYAGDLVGLRGSVTLTLRRM